MRAFIPIKRSLINFFIRRNYRKNRRHGVLDLIYLCIFLHALIARHHSAECVFRGVCTYTTSGHCIHWWFRTDFILRNEKSCQGRVASSAEDEQLTMKSVRESSFPKSNERMLPKSFSLRTDRGTTGHTEQNLVRDAAQIERFTHTCTEMNSRT